MTATVVNAQGLNWRFLTETPMPIAARHQVVLRAQVLDELTGLPPRTGLAVRSPIVGLTPRVSAGGIAGLAGRPYALYPTPWPAVPPQVELQVESDLYLPLRLAGALPPQPGFPAAFAPLDLGTVALHRRPTRISGRVVDAAGTPVAGATVSVSAIWTTVDAILAAGAAPDGLSVPVGLYADRPPGATLRQRTLNLLGGPKTLHRPAAAGTTRIQLSDRQSLVPNRPIAIETGDAERTEYIVAAAIDTTSSADQPAWITLAHPLARAHPQGCAVRRTTLAAPGPANPLALAARAGDATILTVGLAGFAPGQPTLEITGGGPVPEYHGIGLWATTTGADGGYALPPIHRLAHLELTASGGGPPASTSVVISLSGAPAITADLVFP